MKEIEIDEKTGIVEMNIPDIQYPPSDERHPAERRADFYDSGAGRTTADQDTKAP